MPGPRPGAEDRPVNKNGCCLCPPGPYTVLGKTGKYITCQEVIDALKKTIRQHKESTSDRTGSAVILSGVVIREDHKEGCSHR